MKADYINYYLQKTNGYLGTYARDMIPKHVKYPCSLIVNTHTIDKPGEHWIAIYIDEYGFGEYFDPYGLPPLFQEYYNFLNKNTPSGYFYNKTQLQCLTCVTCGHYCIAYIKLRTNGITYKEFIRLFTDNPVKNDKIILKYVASMRN
jgi:hypothetical protein